MIGEPVEPGMYPVRLVDKPPTYRCALMMGPDLQFSYTFDESSFNDKARTAEGQVGGRHPVTSSGNRRSGGKGFGGHGVQVAIGVVAILSPTEKRFRWTRRPGSGFSRVRNCGQLAARKRVAAIHTSINLSSWDPIDQMAQLFINNGRTNHLGVVNTRRSDASKRLPMLSRF